MRAIVRTCLALLVLYLGYVVARVVYRAVRRAMGLPVAEPPQEERLLRQAIIGTFASTLVPVAFLQLDRGMGRGWVLLLMSPAFFGAGVLWVSGVKALVGLYRREPRLLLHPTVFLCCVVAALSTGLTGIGVWDVIRQFAR